MYLYTINIVSSITNLVMKDIAPDFKTTQNPLENQVYIDEEVLRYVRLIREKNSELGYPHGDGDFLFWRNNHNTKHETKLCSNRTFDNLIRRYSKSCGFKYVYSPHDLRRTYVSVLGTHNVPIKEIQQQVGHSTPEMTLRYFRQVSTDKQKKEVLSNAFQSLKKKKA